MNTFNTVVKFFVDCGPFLYPSLLMMAVGLAIAVERYIFLSKARSENRKTWEQVLPLLQAGKFREVAALASKSESAIGKIIGNRELPKVLYIVPWKKPLPGNLSGRPVQSVLDEALAPVDREVFRRQVNYSGQVQAQLSAKAEKAADKATDNKPIPPTTTQPAPGATR